MDFTDKTVLITGGAAGIGRATAMRFADGGANVVIADQDEVAGARTVADLRSKGTNAVFIATNVADANSVANMVKKCVEQFGQLDCAINNAGVELEWAPIVEADEKQFDKIIAVNVKGVWLCLRQEIRQMLIQGGGAIVNTASIAGMKAAPNMAAYSASKHAVVGLTKTAAIECAPTGIRVNAVCPGVIATEMTERAVAKGGANLRDYLPTIHPMGRVGTADEVAAAIVWLCSHESGFTTGSVLPIEGGSLAR